ncbi:MAG TPA: tetratricopeptide repeat protein, partial [Sphingomonadales bacterium]|nr:tetratricopeptide repeat protein [Sphingomonadales bacterium]
LYPLAYYPHNLHFLVWSAMFQGRSKEALVAARQVASAIPENSTENSWALYETFRSQPMFVMVRFGKWAEMLAEPQPDETARFMTGVWHYGRGMAYINQGKVIPAQTELAQLVKLRENAESDQSYYLGFGAAGALLTIAEEVLTGEIAGKQGKYKDAITHLDRAVRLEDGLRYNEPSDWYFPVRHVLGALLLEAGYPAEAEVVYWEDLRRNPKNGYSLFGLKQSLIAQGKTDIANVTNARFIRAWQNADVDLKTSRY